VANDDLPGIGPGGGRRGGEGCGAAPGPEFIDDPYRFSGMDRRSTGRGWLETSIDWPGLARNVDQLAWAGMDWLG
jgi:hypothetical protein